MSVSSAGTMRVSLNRARGANIWLPKYYTYFEGSVVGDNSGGNATVGMYYPALNEELFFVLDNWAGVSQVVGATISLFIPTSCPALETIAQPATDFVIEQKILDASITHFQNPASLPRLIGRCVANDRILTMNLGANTNTVTGWFLATGRLFDHEPMGAM